MISQEEEEEELPLPSFAELFGEGVNAARKRRRDARETSGRWTAEEHRLFLEGVMLYGKEWKKMQPLIKTRSLVQIRTHAQKVFKKIGQKKSSSESEEADADDGAADGGPTRSQVKDAIQRSITHSYDMGDISDLM
jgi:SHAQKYF class myb-like DNA-binding protein